MSRLPNTVPLFLICWLASLGAAAAPPVEGQGHALLVGVTNYPHLNKSLSLAGGANDVLLMEDLLRTRHGFAARNVTILSEAAGSKDANRLPTRANVARELGRLATRVRMGDRVVVFLSGHGSRQPEPPGVPNPQPDGCDKVFLPRDVTRWDGKKGTVPGAITGRELGGWLRPMVQKGASLWVIVDSCHSGTMIRSASERTRQLEADRDLGVPARLLEGADTRGKRETTQGFSVPLERLPGVVLTYACQSNEVTVERDFPDEGGKPYGLFTWTLNRILRGAGAALTYREMVRRVHHEYAGMGRLFPTPVITGTDSDRVVQGRGWLRRSLIRLGEEGDDLRVDSGLLAGLTRGSILAVYPPAGEKGGLRGYVRVVRVEPLHAVVEPCAFGKVEAANRSVLRAGRCEVAMLDLGELKLEVAIDRAGSKASAADLKALQYLLAKRSADPAGPIRLVSDPGRATWLVRLRDDKATVIPAAEAAGTPRTVIGPFDVDSEALGAGLTRVMKAHNLLKLASLKVDSDPENQPRARLEVYRLDPKTEKVLGKAPGDVPGFEDGDAVQYRIHNTGKVAIDVTLLYVDSQMNLEALFPQNEYNRIQPGEKVLVPTVNVEARTTGREQVVLIAVRARSLERSDFTSLAEKTPSGARAVASKQGGANSKALQSPLGQVLRRALYREEKLSRGMVAEESVEYALEIMTVQVVGKKAGS